MSETTTAEPGPAAALSRLTYIGPTAGRPRYHLVDSSRDVINRDRRTVLIEDARLRAQKPSLAREGFELFLHKSAVSDFSNQDALARIYPGEVERLVKQLSGADEVIVVSRGVLRFNTRDLPLSSHFEVMRPVPFVHVDVSESTAAQFSVGWRSKENGRPVRRRAYYNVWRVVTPPPQDTPLAVCDARSVSLSDLVEIDAVTDIPGQPESTLALIMLRYSPEHRWSYYSNMETDEVLVFKSHDSDPDEPCRVPHSAFRNPVCTPGALPRASIDIRAMALWMEN